MVGGGNTAVEEALYLSNIASKVHVIHRRDKFRAEAILVDKMMAKVADGKMQLHLWSTLDEVLGDDKRRHRRARPQHAGRPASEIAVTGCFIAIGHQPNTDIFKGQLEMRDGYILTKSGLDGLATDDQRAGRVRRGRRAGPRLPPGDHERRHRLHGRARRPALPRAGLRARRRAATRL